MPASRYVGEFVEKDITNGVQYLADLVWSWDIGCPLSDWNLAGTTPPVIAANGKLELLENSPGIHSTSYCWSPYFSLKGEFYAVSTFRFQRMNDDTSNDNMAFYGNMGYWQGWVYRGQSIGLAPFVPTVYYTGNNDLGVSGALGGVATIMPGETHKMTFIRSPEKVIFLMDDKFGTSYPIGAKGTAPPGDTPCLHWRQGGPTFSGGKLMQFYCRHDALETSHFQVWDIKVGRLVGQGGL